MSVEVLIFEPEHAGHRLGYLRQVTQAVVELGLRPRVMCTARARQTAEFAQHMGDLLGKVELSATLQVRPVRNPTLRAYQQLRQLRRTLAEYQPGHVLVPSVDGLAQRMGVRGRAWPGARDVQVEGLLFRLKTTGYPSSWWQRCHNRMAAWWTERAPLSAVHVVDPLLWKALRERGGNLAARVALMPDPAILAATPEPMMSKEEARTYLGLPTQGRMLVCAGRLDPRKGLRPLLAAWGMARRQREDRLLLAGRLSAEGRALVPADAAAQGVVVLDRYLTDREMRAALLAGDVVAAAYPRHVGSSALVINAAALGRPVLAAMQGWLQWGVEQFDLGWCGNVEQADILARKMEEALEAAPGWRRSARGDRFVQYHSVGNFQAHWTAGLRQRLGMQPASALQTWEALMS